MQAPEEVRRALSTVEPLISSVQQYVRATLRPYCDDRYIFVDRIKSLTSLSEKIETGRFKRWSDIEDLYACTIVVPTGKEEDSVLDFLGSSFEKKKVRGRDDTQKAPYVFRFDGLRWYGSLRAEAAATRLPGIDQVVFEVQVLTAFEYAWVTVTHSRAYKSGDADWRRQRLAAQLKAAVEQIDMIIDAYDTSSAALRESIWPENIAQQAIIARFQGWIAEGLVSETLAPGSWGRFAENVYALVGEIERNPQARLSWLERFLDHLETDLKGPRETAPIISGTLYQYVVAALAKNGHLGKLRRSSIVLSSELRDLYGVTNVPVAFEFDLPNIASPEGDDTPASTARQRRAACLMELDP